MFTSSYLKTPFRSVFLLLILLFVAVLGRTQEIDADSAESLFDLAAEAGREKNYVSSMEYAQKALDFYVNTSDSVQIARTFYLLARANKYLHQPEKSVFAAKEGLRFLPLRIDTLLRCKFLSAIATSIEAYADNLEAYQKRDSAKKYYDLAVHFAEGLRDTSYLARLKLSISNYHWMRSQLDEALRYNNEAFQLLRRTKDSTEFSMVYEIRAWIYQSSKKYKEALVYADSALFLSRKFKKEQQELRNLVNRANIYAKLNDYERAYEDMKSRSLLIGRYYLKENQRLTIEMEARFDTERKEKEIAQQQATIAQQDAKIRLRGVLALSIGIIMLFILGAFALYYQRRRFRMIQQIQAEQMEAQRLKELDAFKSRFITNITHEFRTPLTVIQGMSAQIKGQEKTKSLIERNSSRLLQLINQLLDLSRLQSNSLEVDWVNGDIVPYLQYLTESCQSLALNKKLNLAFFAKEERLIMDYDENKLQQIAINLLANAIKFTPEYGSVKLIVEREHEHQLLMTVTDTGMGIAPNQLPHIFDRFYQADDTGTRQEAGSGIGLSLVKELVQLMGGSISVKSETDRGSSFYVRLPIHQEAQARSNDDYQLKTIISPAESQVAEAPLSTPGGAEKPLILVIEDNADIADYISSCLHPTYDIQTARNGRLGVEKALEIIPDVILCDVMMPEMDGFEVTRLLKNDRLTSHIPIVLLTAKATQEDRVIGLKQGADAYLTKPFDQEELLVRLENLAAQSKLLRENLAASPAAAASTESTREAQFLQELQEIIEARLSDELFNTQELCRAIGMSRAQLHRKLKALTDQPTASYIRSIRLRKAKEMLETTDLPIGEVADAVGYKDFSHFSRSYVKEWGVKPSETRK